MPDITNQCKDYCENTSSSSYINLDYTKHILTTKHVLLELPNQKLYSVLPEEERLYLYRTLNQTYSSFLTKNKYNREKWVIEQGINNVNYYTMELTERFKMIKKEYKDVNEKRYICPWFTRWYYQLVYKFNYKRGKKHD